MIGNCVIWERHIALLGTFKSVTAELEAIEQWPSHSSRLVLFKVKVLNVFDSVLPLSSFPEIQFQASGI